MCTTCISAHISLVGVVKYFYKEKCFQKRYSGS
jgi:hypothetical protein